LHPESKQSKITNTKEGEFAMHKPTMGAILVGLIPFLAMCISVPLWDRIYPFVLGLPFNIFWIVLWILLTPLCMFFAYRIERKKIDATEGAEKGGVQHG
jgi:hypothetical protein